ncbi:MAG: AAA family ATPase [Gemmatimonadetes bacterium]|nr:AAA family ATPase [Gemmatimonadota bacterium]
MIHLRSIAAKRNRHLREGFPFDVPIIRALGEIRFTSPVTFLVGENGCGKSTILEGIACAVGFITVGSDAVDSDHTLTAV